MTNKRRTSVTLSQPAVAQLQRLAQTYGNQSTALEVAISNLHREATMDSHVIAAAELVDYDNRTDVIERKGDDQDAAELMDAIRDDGLDVTIVEPVHGWGEYTHLLRIEGGEYHLGPVYYLATLAPNS